jgi:hypothetical protein
MSRFLAALFPLALAGCIGTAAADALDHDVITLVTGERLVGELVDVQDGKYWMLLSSGRMVATGFHDVARVEMAGAEPVAPAEIPLPEWTRGQGGATGGAGTIGGGFDFGLLMGGRLRFHIESPAIDHVDLRLATSLLWASSVGAAAYVGGEVAFFGESPVHLALSVNAGPALVSGSLYPFIGLGAGLQFDPRGPFEVHLGAIVGTDFSSLAIAPELSTSWVW